MMFIRSMLFVWSLSHEHPTLMWLGCAVDSRWMRGWSHTAALTLGSIPSAGKSGKTWNQEHITAWLNHENIMDGRPFSQQQIAGVKCPTMPWSAQHVTRTTDKIGQQDYQRPQTIQPRILLPAAVWQTVPQSPVLHHQTQEQLHPAGHNTAELLSSQAHYCQFTCTILLHLLTALFNVNLFTSLYIYCLLILAHIAVVCLFTTVYKLLNHHSIYIYEHHLCTVLLAVSNWFLLSLYSLSTLVLFIQESQCQTLLHCNCCAYVKFCIWQIRNSVALRQRVQHQDPETKAAKLNQLSLFNKSFSHSIHSIFPF